MKKLIISIILLATVAQAEPMWIAGREQDWDKNKKGFKEVVVALLNPQTTNSYTESNVVHYVTNYTHTASNSNNVLHQINFGYKDSANKNAWIFGYDTLNCGGFDIDAQWLVVEDFCKNNKKLTAGRGMGLGSFMFLNGYTQQSNQWLVLSIPYVSDIKKVNERKAEFQKEKK